MPFAHVRSRPRSNLSLITAGEAKSRSGTFPCSARITFLPLGSLLPHSMFFYLSQLLRCLSLIFLSFLSYSSPSPLSRNILYPPPPHLFLDLCFLLSLPVSFCLPPIVPDAPRGETHRVELLRSFGLLLLSLLRIQEGPVYQ